MPADLSGALAKYRRGNKHLYVLCDEVAQWLNANGHDWTLELDPNRPDRTRFQERLTITGADPLHRWAVLIGDAVHNYRAALDHAVYALAVWYEDNDPPSDERILQFPICDGPERWKKSLWRIKSLPRPVRAEINLAQPYKGVREGYVRPLALLRDLDDSDKHRLLHLAVQIPWDAGARFREPPLQGTVHAIFSTGVLEDQAIAAKFYFSQPQTNVDMDWEVTLRVALEMPPGDRPYGGVTEMLAGVRMEVRRVLARLQRFAY